jgi:predicted DNA-binding transcriptional regulator AlpA
MHIDKRAARILADHVSEGADDQLLTTKEVASWLQVSTQWLEILRGRAGGPKYTQLSNRMVMYRRDAIRSWLTKRQRSSTKENAR